MRVYLGSTTSKVPSTYSFLNNMVKGFHIEDDGTRVAMDYDSEEERAYCECLELLEHKHYAEAFKRLQDYHKHNNGFVDKHDTKWILKVEVGNLNVKPTKTNFKRCARIWESAAYRSGGDDEDLTYIAHEIIGHFTKAFKIPVEYDNFKKATAKQSIQLLDFIIDFFVIPGAECNVPLCDRDFLYPVAFGIRHLVANGEKRKAKGLYNKVVEAGFGQFNSFMEEQEIEF